ncbi:hypothetical protein RRG08_004583 [Elysia crispata]|uniref:Uncharacterized protein n=1 Tax=Elysia crispata TaxID=231223 RepID=A0AAE1E0G7_9GAST|nr:hypothetical protein RRG08_004583 [Elysia crispata]
MLRNRHTDENFAIKEESPHCSTLCDSQGINDLASSDFTKCVRSLAGVHVCLVLSININACVGGGDHHDNGCTTASTSNCHVSSSPCDGPAGVGGGGGDGTVATEGIDSNSTGDLLDFQAEVERGPPTKQECSKMVYSLSKEVAVYCWLSMGLGAATDSYSLRDELKASSQKLFDLVLLCKRRLVPLLLSKRVKEEEREDLERLYRIFAGCLETLQAEFIRAITLQSIFPLWDTNAHLIQTGASESVCLKKCFPLEPLDASALNRQISDNEEFQNLERKVLTLQELSYTTSQMMDVNPWDYKPDTDHTKIDVETSEMEPEDPPAAPANNVHVNTGARDSGGRRQRKCVIWTVALSLGISIVIAGVLGLIFAFANENEEK